jgi:Trypsin-like peptidase domain
LRRDRFGFSLSCRKGGFRTMHRRSLGLTALLLLSVSTRLEASCIDPASLAHAAVSITRYLDETERAAQPSLIGTRGTAWFLSPATIVTAEHVSAGMMLAPRDWKQLEIRDGDVVRSIPVRVARVVGTGPEKLAVLALQSEFPGARSAAIRTEPLAPEDQVVTFAFPQGRPRVVGGRFVKYGDDERLAGAALLEMFDGNDRMAVDYGASGAPVYDCDGRVGAVVSTVITQTIPMMSGRIRTSTAWGTPNVLSIPIQALKEYTEAQ